MLRFRFSLLSKLGPISRSVGSLQCAKLSIPAAPRVKQDGRLVELNWTNGHSDTADSWSKFHFKWLRDNCQCKDCHHPDYHQRLLSTLEDATPASCASEGNSLTVRWKDGHESEFPYDWLKANSYFHHNVTLPAEKKWPQEIWDLNSLPNPTVDYQAMMTDDKKLLHMLREVYRYGFCLITDTPGTEQAPIDAAKRVGPIKHTYYGGDQWFMETAVLHIEHIAYGRINIYPHTDNPAISDPTGLFYFHCLKSEGESTKSSLIDGYKLAAYIKEHQPECFTVLSNVSFVYALDLKFGTYKMRRKTFTLNEDGEVDKLYLNNIDRRPLDETSLTEAQNALSCSRDEAFTKIYDALTYLHELIYGETITYYFDLPPKTILLMDNQRVLHGRGYINSTYRKVSGLYVNREEWISKMKMLETASDQ